MQRHQHVLPALQAPSLDSTLRVDPGAQGHQGVDHRVADVVDRRRVAPLGHEVSLGLGGVREEEVRHPIGEDPVDLLGHRPVEAPQPRLDVADRDAHLHRDERGGERGVHVAGDEHHIGLLLLEHRLEALHHPGGLLGVRAGSHVEQMVRCSDPELLEEDVGHRGVVVLPGVDEGGLELLRPVRERTEDRPHLHEVGPGPDDRQDLLGRHPRSPRAPAARARRRTVRRRILMSPQSDQFAT